MPFQSGKVKEEGQVPLGCDRVFSGCVVSEGERVHRQGADSVGGECQ